MDDLVLDTVNVLLGAKSAIQNREGSRKTEKASKSTYCLTGITSNMVLYFIKLEEGYYGCNQGRRCSGRILFYSACLCLCDVQVEYTPCFTTDLYIMFFWHCVECVLSTFDSCNHVARCFNQ